MTKTGYKQLKIYGDTKFDTFNDEQSENIIAIGTK